jgi:hypothetical protein
VARIHLPHPHPIRLEHPHLQLNPRPHQTTLPGSPQPPQYPRL